MIKTGQRLNITFFLAFLVIFPPAVFAQDANSGIILRPVVEYKSGDLRDPFSDLFLLNKERNAQNIQVTQENLGLEKILPNLENFKVKGVIWGGRLPQAIINDKILKVGDSIDGVEIVDIDKTGISLSFGGEIIVLPTPGNAPVSDKEDKKDKQDKEEK
ncbi:MAG: hypothetical protein PHU59_02905 [Candidatus Omnitrophica bacterium]|nr:hypothetical protein [Candidatus Omnitrophota bacterium]